MAKSRSDDEESLSSTSSAPQDAVNLDADEEWQDAEPDQEKLEFLSLFDDAVFSSFEAMLEHCKITFEFDLQRVVKELGIDFYGSIKLVNYIRSQVAKGKSQPSVASKEVFDSEEYLKPVLQDDAVLFCLDDLVESGDVEKLSGAEGKDGGSTDAFSKIKELEEQLQKVQEQFAEYRQAVGKTLDERWADRAGPSTDASAATNGAPKRDDDTHYFDSYSYNEIHEIMLKDTPRTASYRDFIYDNKRLFTDKLVLDVGCGTGILSMLSARAGARHVIAADNSAIIDRAREIISVNNLGDRITCARGKVEDMASLPLPPASHTTTSTTTPAGKVDILVSEWMGYMLLYEAMLDSVISARDRFLDPHHGLMVPSHCTLHIAPVADPDYIADSVAWWGDVYGFDMRAMTRHMHDDVLVRAVDARHVAGRSACFRTLDLHTVTVAELVFEAPFEVVLDRDVDALDAWVVWFDTFFLPGRGVELPDDARAETWKEKGGDGGVAFTTGPGGTTTHWQAGLLVVDRTKKDGAVEPLKKGQRIVGSVEYKKREVNSRELEVKVTWAAEGTREQGEQMWIMR